ncbi:MAG: glycosyltransferase [Thermoguttaceae bacterium]
MITAAHILLTAYAFVGLAYWLWTLIGVIRVVRNVPILADENPPAPESRPTLAVVIAARDEADTLEPALRSLLGQDYPDLRVVLVDDRSTDGTGEKADALAATNPRLEVVHVRKLPEEWLGKVYALAQGAERVDSDWLLFTDADIHFAPGALRKAVAFAEARPVDHLAAAPDLLAPNALMDSMIQAFLRAFSVGLRLWAVEDPKSRAFAGVGAFNLVRRSALEQTPGFEWLRLEVADDVGLGLMIKQHGGRSVLANARGLIRVAWYPSFAAAARGAEKGFASVGHCSVPRMLLVSAVGPLLELAPLLLPIAAWLPVPYGVPGLQPAAMVVFAAAAVSMAVVSRWSRRRFLPSLLLPAAVLVGAWLLLRTTWLGWRRGGIVWRNTLYPSNLLRGKLRVRIP